ncbi:thioesterase domain-containing protein, partial [Vibrio sp. 10N.237.312.B06]|uniref:thioesterase domain-containing protein n=1 Tax=Vibrio sp. 10N.237.312.B06 TaxID=3229974 RepID=UPI00354EA612
GLDAISVLDNFFTIGGHSLLAMRLFNMIEEIFKINVSLNCIITHPTIEKLSLIIDENKYEPSLLVPLKKTKSEKNIFCVHPIGGQISFYQELSKRIKSECNIYAIQSSEVASIDLKIDNIESLARVYGELIKETQPHGPYKLLGWSSGGLIALAIANYLESEGNEVDYLCIVDPSSIPSDLDDQEKLFIASVIVMLSSIVGRSLNYFERSELIKLLKSNRINHKNFSDGDIFDILFEFVKEKIEKNISLEISTNIKSQLHVTYKHLEFLSNFKPRLTNAKLHLCVAEDGLLKSSGYKLENELKNAFKNGLIYFDRIKGNHYDILEHPNVELLALSIDSML